MILGPTRTSSWWVWMHWWPVCLYKRFKSYNVIMHAACFRPPVEILTFNIFLVEYVFLIHYTCGMLMFYSMFWDVLKSILSFSEESEMISNASLLVTQNPTNVCVLYCDLSVQKVTFRATKRLLCWSRIVDNITSFTFSAGHVLHSRMYYFLCSCVNFSETLSTYSFV